jgi:hypothetical protein
MHVLILEFKQERIKTTVKLGQRGWVTLSLQVPVPAFAPGGMRDPFTTHLRLSDALLLAFLRPRAWPELAAGAALQAQPLLLLLALPMLTLSSLPVLLRRVAGLSCAP